MGNLGDGDEPHRPHGTCADVEHRVAPARELGYAHYGGHQAADRGDQAADADRPGAEAVDQRTSMSAVGWVALLALWAFFAAAVLPG